MICVSVCVCMLFSNAVKSDWRKILFTTFWLTDIFLPVKTPSMFNISAKSSFIVFSVWVYVPQNRVEILWLQQIARRDPRRNGAPRWSEYHARIKHLSEKQMMQAQIYLVQNVLFMLWAELTNVELPF